MSGTSNRVITRIKKETEGVHLRLALAQAIINLLPYGSASGLRSTLYSRAGFGGVSRKAFFGGKLDIYGNGDIYSRLQIGEGTWISGPAFIDLNGTVKIGNRVGIGHHLMIITSTHKLGPASERMGKLNAKPVVIEDGVWLAAQVTILPGVTIGSGAFVMAGAVVTKDVPPNAKVAGNHAQIVGWLDEGAR